MNVTITENAGQHLERMQMRDANAKPYVRILISPTRFQYTFIYDEKNENDLSICVTENVSFIADQTLDHFLDGATIGWRDTGIYGAGFVITK